MVKKKNISVGIVGIGSYVPEKVVTNTDLEKMVETSDEWIRTRTGIIERRIIAADENVSDLALRAAEKALTDAQLEPQEIDLIVVATASPEMIWPSTACLVGQKLGIKCPAFDISAACTGFVYGLSVAGQFVASGEYRNVLLIGADALSRFVDWADRNVCILFGDGAGALVLREVEEGYGFLGSYLAADGSGADLLKIPAGGSALPGDEKTIQEGLHYIKMNGNEVFKFAVYAMEDAIHQVLKKCHLKLSEIDYFIPHQANQRIIEAARNRLKIDQKKIISNIHKYGNTSTASIPLALEEIWREGRLKRGNLVLMIAFGGGLTWGANVLRWSRES